MARKYTREGFRSTAKGMWHRGKDAQDPVARTRISPEQAKRLLSIGLMAACALYVSGLIFSKAHQEPDSDQPHAIADIVSKSAEQNDRFYVILDVPQEEGDPIQAKVRVDRAEWDTFEPGGRIGVSYRTTSDGIAVDTLYRAERESDTEEPQRPAQ